MSFSRARSVGVVGSGTAGLFAALALKRARPELQVAIIASPTIPIIGVGEATTPPLVAFLHGYLGIDAGELFARVRPTWKLGIRFDWTRPDTWFPYAFGGGDLASAVVHDGHIRRYSRTALLMDAGRGPLVREGDRVRSLLSETRLAYHLDNAPFVAFLEEVAAARGITFERVTVVDVRPDPYGGVDSLVVEGGGTLRYDAYVDASGFRAQLLGGALGVPFSSYASSLLCDAAVVGNGPHASPQAGPAPYTRATTMPAGWCWTIPMREENHYGYVFASAFTSPEEAERDLRATFRIEGRTRVVRFRSGRREQLIRGNVAAVGNAYGFVEPLESTALHMALTTSLRLAALASGALDDAESVSREIGEQWDYLRWFLALHYRFNGRLDTRFWAHCRAAVDIRGVEAALEDYRQGPLYTQRPAPPAFVRDTVFGARGLDILLLGQEVRPVRLEPDVDGVGWEQRQRDWAEEVERALPHADALDLFASDAVVREDLVARGWVREMAGAMRRLAPSRAAGEMRLASVR